MRSVVDPYLSGVVLDLLVDRFCCHNQHFGVRVFENVGPILLHLRFIPTGRFSITTTTEDCGKLIMAGIELNGNQNLT